MSEQTSLIEWRKNSGLSQEAAGNLLSTTQETWCRYETGAAKPSPAKAVQIERLTNGAVTAAQLRPDVFLPPEER